MRNSTESEEWRPSFLFVNFQKSLRWNKYGCRGFSQKRKCYILLSNDGDKAHGQDDFTVCFFRAYSETLKEDLMQTIHNFHQNEFLEKSFNATFIALIPKKFEAEE